MITPAITSPTMFQQSQTKNFQNNGGLFFPSQGGRNFGDRNFRGCGPVWMWQWRLWKWAVQWRKKWRLWLLYQLHHSNKQCLCAILKFVVASTAEAELGTFYLNYKKVKIIWLTLDELGYSQSHTYAHCNNTTATGITNNTVKCQQSWSTEIRFFGWAIR